jgi:hypothetical protein
MIHWLVLTGVVYACSLVLVAIACTPYLRRRNFHKGYMHHSRRCHHCGHTVEGYTFDEIDYKEQLHIHTAHATLVMQQVARAA